MTSHYSTILKNQHNINGNNQNNINKNLKTNSNDKTNKENVKKNPPSTQKFPQNNSKTTIRRDAIFKSSSKI